MSIRSLTLAFSGLILTRISVCAGIDLGTPAGYTPYDRYMSPVRQVLGSLHGHTVDFQRVQNLLREGRSFRYSFTDPYVVATEGLLVRSGTGITSLESMKGRTVAVVKGSTNADVLRDRGVDVKVAEFDSSQAAVLAVKQGQADAMVEDSNFLQYQAKLNPGLEVVTSNLVPLEYNAFGVKQGDQVWVSYLNQFLFDLNTSGKNLELYRKWFGTNPRFPLRPAF